MSDKEFIPGLFAKAPHPNSPDFVKMGVSIKIQDLGNYLREVSKTGEEWVNIQVKESQGGKWYAERDNWKPNSEQAQNEGYSNTGGNTSPPPSDFDNDEPPF